jgi:hypothetical protein
MNPERVAVVGSRKGVNLDLVREFVQTLFRDNPSATIISGGAVGVDITAEQAWLDLGGKVISFRTFKVSQDSWGIEEWRLGGGEPAVIQHVIPTFADPKSALFFRNTMISDAADVVVSFTNQSFSPGTRFTKAYTKDRGRPVYEMVA